MFQPDFYYSDQGEKIPLPPRGDSLAIAYRTEVPPKDLEALIRGDDLLARFVHSEPVAQRRIILYKRSPAARVSLEGFADRLLRSDQISYVTLVALRGGSPVVITDEFLTGFKPEVGPEAIAALHAHHGVERVERPSLHLGPGEMLLRVRQPGAGGALPVANRYFESGLVQYAEPDFILLLDLQLNPNDELFPRQWNFPRMRVPEAWDITRGDPAVVISIADTGIDTDHEDFASPGKIAAQTDVFSSDSDPRPPSGEEEHGTAVAGLAVADGNNVTGISGVAPRCRMIAIRLLGTGPSTGIFSAAASALRFGADQGASILSNSWSFAPPIASSVRLAIDHAISNGRGGKGCPVFFAAGNANRLVTTGTALAEHDDVILVAASNDRNVRSGYSNFGPEISLNAASDGTSADSPSWRVRMAMAGGTFQEDTSTLLITTTDRTGPDEGLNAPDASPSRPDPAELPSNYTSRFGGTSAACPQAAGVAALMLSVNPDLTHRQVRFLLEATADKIDAANPDPVGRYQPNGHSQSYGFGRVNALEAVKAARASVPQDATERVFVRLRRTSGNRFVSTQILHVVDARRRPASTAGDLFVRTGPDAFLRAKLDSVIGPLIAEAEVNE